MTQRRIKSVPKPPRVYAPGDPRMERFARLGAVRQKAEATVAVAVEEEAVATETLTREEVIALLDQGRTLTVSFSETTNLAAGAFFRLFGGATCSGTIGFTLPFGVVLEEAVGTKGNAATTCLLALRDGTSVIYSMQFTAAATLYETGLNVAIDEGAILNALVDATSANPLTGGGSLVLVMRKRIT